MTLDYLVVEYLGKNNYENNYKRISKEIDDLFITLNVDPILFKESEKRNSPWNFPESCKEELLTLIKLLYTGDKNLISIRKNDVKNIDLKVLIFCINTVCKALRELGKSEDIIQEVKTKMLDFTGYSLISVKKSAQELIDDFDYMYDNYDDKLSFSDHTVFQKYAESEIRKLQEQLRFTYYSMNSKKGNERMLKASREVKQINKDGALTEYLQKSMQGNQKLIEEFGELRMLTVPNNEEIKIRKEQIEIELFGEKLQKHPYVKYSLESLELEEFLEEDEEYKNLLKENSDILNKKLTIKSKIERVAKKEVKMLERKKEISQEVFGHKLTVPIEKEELELEEEEESSYQLLKNGIYIAEMWRQAEQGQNEEEWPIMISMCKNFFNKNNKE